MNINLNFKAEKMKNKINITQYTYEKITDFKPYVEFYVRNSRKMSENRNTVEELLKYPETYKRLYNKVKYGWNRLNEQEKDKWRVVEDIVYFFITKKDCIPASEIDEFDTLEKYCDLSINPEEEYV